MGKTWPRKARVIAVYPGAYAVDVQYLSDRGIAPRVPVMTSGPVTNSTGTVDLPTPDGNADSGYTGLRDMTAVVDLIDGDPVVVGFLHPRVNQLLFDEVERRVVRHASDVYTSLDKDGNFEFSHPSGTFFRFGVTPDHEDLAGQNHDQNWAIERNKDKAIHANLEVWNGGVMKAKLHIDPDGNLVQELKGTLSQTVDGAVTQTLKGGVTQNVTGNVTADVSGNVDVTTPLAKVNGDAEVTGKVTVANGGGFCVTTQSVCAFTGSPHPAGSPKANIGGG